MKSVLKCAGSTTFTQMPCREANCHAVGCMRLLGYDFLIVWVERAARAEVRARPARRRGASPLC